MIENDVTRKRLGGQLAQARHGKQWKLRDVAHRSTSAPGRLSLIETGKANVTIDVLAQTGEAVGLELVFVPKERLEEVLALIGQAAPETHLPTEVRSVYDEMFIPDRPEDDEETPSARP